MRGSRKLFAIVAAAVVAASTSLASAQLLIQPPHVPGTANNNGVSAMQGIVTQPNTLDREIADDFSVPAGGWNVTGVASSWVQNTPGDTNPITAMNILFFQRTGGGGVGALFHTATNVSVVRSTGPGTYFSRPEQILTASFDSFVLPQGDYFMMIQPQVNHNWFWLTHGDWAVTQKGSKMHGQRGASATAGQDPTWPATWTPMGPVAGGGAGVFLQDYDMNFTINGTPVPEPAGLTLLGLGGLALLARRRNA